MSKTIVSVRSRKLFKLATRVFIGVAATTLLGFIVIVGIDYHVRAYSEPFIVRVDHVPADSDTIIILGAYVYPDGTPSDMVTDRLKTALEIYNGTPMKILVTGDHGRKEYDEVNAMKDYLIKNGPVQDETVFMDHAGFNTYESMYRANEIFGVQKAVIVTQEYHLYRAIYNARKMGIEAYGVSADRQNYRGMDYYKLREIVARNKDFLLDNILKPKPTFLGEAIPITTDGRLTNDR